MSIDRDQITAYLKKRIDRNDPDGCWLWRLADTSVSGWVERQVGDDRCYRVIWILAHGPIPSGMEIRHTCGRHACCRLDHLFQSDPANGHPRVRRDRADRFWAMVDKTDTCWLWTAATNAAGYGMFMWDAHTSRVAHRCAYELAHGRDAIGVLRHTCNNRRCVRPDHLQPGTRAENYADMVAAGRRSSTAGERNPLAKLSEADVQAIRHTAKRAGHRKGIGAELARQYGVTSQTIQLILRRVTWKETPDL